MDKDNQANQDHHADQLNSNNTDLSQNNDAYKSAQDNHADQLNPNNSK
jgi:hypothetical protein